MIFADSLDPNQAQQNAGPDLDPNFRHSDSVPERIFEKVNFENYLIMKITQHAKSHSSPDSTVEIKEIKRNKIGL